VWYLRCDSWNERRVSIMGLLGEREGRVTEVLLMLVSGSPALVTKDWPIPNTGKQHEA
jgi:hypothetical protein